MIRFIVGVVCGAVVLEAMIAWPDIEGYIAARVRSCYFW